MGGGGKTLRILWWLEKWPPLNHQRKKEWKKDREIGRMIEKREKKLFEMKLKLKIEKKTLYVLKVIKTTKTQKQIVWNSYFIFLYYEKFGICSPGGTFFFYKIRLKNNTFSIFIYFQFFNNLIVSYK